MKGNGGGTGHRTLHARALSRVRGRVLSRPRKRGREREREKERRYHRTDMHAHCRARAARQQGRTSTVPSPHVVRLVPSRFYSVFRLSHDRINITMFLLLSIYRIYTYVHIMNSSVTTHCRTCRTSRDRNLQLRHIRTAMLSSEKLLPDSDHL